MQYFNAKHLIIISDKSFVFCSQGFNYEYFEKTIHGAQLTSAVTPFRLITMLTSILRKLFKESLKKYVYEKNCIFNIFKMLYLIFLI